MKTRAFLLITLALIMCFSLVACGDKSVTKIEITEGLSLSCEVGTTYDFSKVKATVTYNDGSTVQVTGDELEFGALDTSTVGTKVLTVTYDGFTVNIDIKVFGTTLGGGDQGGDDDGAELYGVEMPDSLVAYDTNKNRFTDKTAVYAVGDANPFTFRLKLLMLDENDNYVTKFEAYESVSKVYLVEVDGTTETEVGTDYVTIDETKNTFDFTPAAVAASAEGKTFRIATCPKDGTAATDTRSITVRVVSGYNVTEAKELNLMTNANNLMPRPYTADDGERHNNANRQLAIVKAFVNNNYGANYYETYGGNALTGIVIHGDLAPTINDLPEPYIIRNQDGSVGFGDAFEVYARRIGEEGFAIYGNYYTINTSNLPTMNHIPETVGGETSSNSQMFGFAYDPDSLNEAERRAFDYTKYKCLIENWALRDNDPNSNNEAENARHMLGLSCFYFRHVDAKIDNSIVEAFSMGMMVFDCNIKVTIEDSTLNNSWMTHVYVYAHNQLQNFGDELRRQDPWDTLTPVEIDVKNSSLTKCGGPVIMTHSKSMDSTAELDRYNINAGSVITVTDSTLESYVTGTEAWFKAYESMGALKYALDLQGMAPLVEQAATAFEGQASTIVTTREGYGEAKFMNLVCAGLSGSVKYIVDDVTIMDNRDAYVTSYMKDPLPIPELGGASLAALGAPLMQSTVDRSIVATYLQGNMDTPREMIFSTGILAGQPALGADFFQGDLLNFYMGAANISVVMGYFHPAA